VDYLSLSIVITLHICLLLQLYYVLVVHRKLAFFKISKSISQNHSPISVIVCAKNEVENLQKNLPLLLNQNYPDFELIVVNDRSYDGTESFLRELSQEHSNLKVVTVVYNPKFKQSKKFAVTLGIKAAKNENLILA
jgi:cellulose synthase/poly-beta-1,6-N-acetylglucosamine synthase-like glycosyltransferase